MGPKLKNAVSMWAVNKLRVTIYKTLYYASLRLVNLNLAKTIIDAGEVLPDKHDETKSDGILGALTENYFSEPAGK